MRSLRLLLVSSGPALAVAVLLGGCIDAPSEVSGSGGSSSTTDTTGPGPIPVTSTSSTSTGVLDGTGSSGSSGGGDTGNPQDCCADHRTPGCDDPELAACVCDQEAFCCAFAWDASCVDLAEQCGGCGAATGTTGETTGGPDPSACCTPGDQPGCLDDPALETCVCGLDAFCCDMQWDDMCVESAQDNCGLVCMNAGGDCCSPSGGLGCNDMVVSDCVCAIDPFCCDTQWDDICVSEAQYACMDACGLPPPNMGDCCMAQPGPGCGDMAVTDCACMVDDACCLFPWDDYCIQTSVTACGIECAGVVPFPSCCLVQPDPGCDDMVVSDCVCAFDAFCCEMQWDGQCVDEAQNDCMLDCSGGDGMGGTGATG